MSPSLPNPHRGVVDIGTSQLAAGRGGRDVFAEITERHSFPILGFSGGAELALGRAKRAAFGEKVPMTSGNSTKYIPFGGSEVDGRDRLTEYREPKWKSRAKS